MVKLENFGSRRTSLSLENLAISLALGGRNIGSSVDQSLAVAKEMLGSWVSIIRKSIPVGALIAIAVLLVYRKQNHHIGFYLSISSILLSYGATYYFSSTWRKARSDYIYFTKYFIIFSLCRFSIGISWAFTLVQAAFVAKGVLSDMLYGIGVALVSMPMFGGSLIFSLLFWLPVTIGFGICFFITPDFAGYPTFIAYILYSLLVLISLANLSKKAIELSLTSVNLRSVSEYLSVAIAELEEQTSDWLWKTDGSLAIVEASPGFRRAVGDGSPLNGVSVLDLFRGSAGEQTGGDLVNEVCVNITHKIKHHEPFSRELVEIRDKNITKWWRISGRPQHDDNMLFTGYIGVGTDVTTDCNLRHRTQYLADHDALTGLINRHKLSFILHNINKSGVFEKIAIVVLDLDFFKQVNDRHGHHIGDNLLSLVGKRLSSHIRAGDSAARLGGDEFCVVLRSVDKIEAETIARRILDSIKEPYQIEQLCIVIGASAGIAFATNDQSGPEELLRLADVAALQAKSERRGELAVFGTDMLEEDRRISTLRTDLISAIELEQFELVFQPIFDLTRNVIIRSEALIRWIHPEFGIVKPDDFIEFAESTGSIILIDEWVILHVFKMFAGGFNKRIAINISSFSLFASDFLTRIYEIILKNKAFAHLLEIEITETAILRLNAGHEEILKALRMLGVTLALDDFGTGQSSLSRLGTIQCDRIKIDRSLAMASIDKYRCKTILRYVVKLAQEIGVSVCVEGIEDSEMLEFCRDIGADEGQGFYLGRPSEVSNCVIV
jgi:diguanylate cyclase (GGDEF)-like protein